MSRSDMQAIWQALRLRRPLPTTTEPAVASLGTLPDRRSRRRSGASPTVAEQPQSAAPRVSPVYVRPQQGGVKAAPPAVSAAPSKEAPAVPASTTSQLLAAKKRRK